MERQPSTHNQSGEQLTVTRDDSGKYVVWNHELGDVVARKSSKSAAVAAMKRLAKKK